MDGEVSFQAVKDDLQPKQGKTLHIEFDPSSPAAFKEALLKTKRAWIVEIGRDGRRTERPWDARNMSENSNVVGNLRSRPRYRSGVWQKHRIASLQVSIERPRQALAEGVPRVLRDCPATGLPG